MTANVLRWTGGARAAGDGGGPQHNKAAPRAKPTTGVNQDRQVLRSAGKTIPLTRSPTASGENEKGITMAEINEIRGEVEALWSHGSKRRLSCSGACARVTPDERIGIRAGTLSRDIYL